MLVIKQSKKFITVFKFSNFTEFALRSKEFSDIVCSKIDSITEENYKDVAKSICDRICVLAKEKAGSVSCLLVKTSCMLNTYFHTYHHGKDLSFICEKAIIMGSDAEWDRISCINSAMTIMGDTFALWRNKYFKMEVESNFFTLPTDELRNFRIESRKRIKIASKIINKKIQFCIVC